MKPIKDSNFSSISRTTIDLRSKADNIKLLSPDEANEHLSMLISMLWALHELAAADLTDFGSRPKGVVDFLGQIRRNLSVLLLKNRIEALTPNRDVAKAFAIDPTESGFPLAVRDMHFLFSDMEKADDELARLPDDRQLVDHALFALFRGAYPAETVLQKLKLKYYTNLKEMAVIRAVKQHKAIPLRQKDGMHYFAKYVERLDEHYNLPRFYVLCLKVPEQSARSGEWKHGLEEAIDKCLAVPLGLELRTLAETLETLEGLQVELVERIDLGPFHNRFTQNYGENKGIAGKLLEGVGDRGGDKDGLIMFRRSAVQRISQERRTGFINFFKGLRSGDKHLGAFSPVITSPLHIIMPHRLIQQAHQKNIDFEDNVKMHGLTKEGSLID